MQIAPAYNLQQAKAKFDLDLKKIITSTSDKKRIVF